MPGIEIRSRSFRRAVRGVLATVIAVTAATTLGGTASASDDRHVARFEAIEASNRPRAMYHHPAWWLGNETGDGAGGRRG